MTHTMRVAIAVSGGPWVRIGELPFREQAGPLSKYDAKRGRMGLVSRFRSSHEFAARSDANFGIKGTLASL